MFCGNIFFSPNIFDSSDAMCFTNSPMEYKKIIYHTNTYARAFLFVLFPVRFPFLLNIGNRSICWCQINQMVSCVGIENCTFQQTSYNVMQFVELSTSGCIFHEFEWMCSFFLLGSICYTSTESLKHNGRSQIKKAIWAMFSRFRFILFCSLVCGCVLITFYIHIKIMLNSIWINWSTILS